MPSGSTLICVADDTSAGLGPEMPTTIGEPAKVDAVLAYSEAAEDDSVERQSWRVTWRRSAMVLVVCLLIAAAVVLGWSGRSPEARTPPSAVAVQPAPVPPTKEAMVSPSAVATAMNTTAQRLTPPDQDTVYLAQLDRVNVHWPTTAESIRNGHLVCQSLDEGDSFQSVATHILSMSGPTVTYGQVAEAVGAAIYAYCPKYQR